MGSCSLLATRLDYEMIAVKRGVSIAPAALPEHRLPRKTGAEVAHEVGERYLVRYLTPAQVGLFVRGSSVRCWVSPTATSGVSVSPTTPRKPETLIISSLAIPSNYLR